MRLSGKTGGLFAWLFGSRREAARLNRDARTIIETARIVTSNEGIREIALRVGDALDTAHARGGGDPARYAPLIGHFRTQHREARRRRDDGALTAMTLVIIYLRAEKIGPDADPARTEIDSFVAQWRHASTASTESRPAQ